MNEFDFDLFETFFDLRKEVPLTTRVADETFKEVWERRGSTIWENLHNKGIPVTDIENWVDRLSVIYEVIRLGNDKMNKSVAEGGSFWRTYIDNWGAIHSTNKTLSLTLSKLYQIPEEELGLPEDLMTPKNSIVQE